MALDLGEIFVKASADYGGIYKEADKVAKSLEQQTRAVENQSRIFGTAMDAEAAKANLLKSAIIDLTNKGLAANDTGVRKLAEEYNRLSSSMQKNAEAAKAAVVAEKEAAKAAQEAGEKTSFLSKALDFVTSKAAIAGATIVAALTAGGIAAIKMAADYEQTEKAFTNMLKSADMAKAFLTELQSFANKTPFEFADLTTASKRLLAFGFQAKEIIPLMTSIGDAASGLGAGTEGMNRIITALSQIKAKGKASTEELLQLSEVGIASFEALAQKLNVSVPQVMKLVTKGAVDANTAIKAVTDYMSKNFGGMMESQSTSLSGMFSTLKDVGSSVLRNIGIQMVQTFNIKGLMQSAITASQSFLDVLTSTPSAQEKVKQQFVQSYSAIDLARKAGSQTVMENKKGEKELQDTMNNIASIFPQVVKEYDSLGNARRIDLKLLDDTIAAEEKLEAIRLKEPITKQAEKLASQIQKEQKEVDRLSNIFSTYTAGGFEGYVQRNTLQGKSDLKEYEKLYYQYVETHRTNLQKANDLLQAHIQERQGLMDKLAKLKPGYVEKETTTKTTTTSTAVEQAKNTTAAIAKDYLKALDAIDQKEKTYTQMGLPFDAASEKVKLLQSTINELSGATDAFTSVWNSFTDGLASGLKSVQSEQAKNTTSEIVKEYLKSIELIDQQAEAYGKIGLTFDKTGETLKLLEGTLGELTSASDAFTETWSTVIDGFGVSVNLIKEQIEATKKLASVQKLVSPPKTTSPVNAQALISKGYVYASDQASLMQKKATQTPEGYDYYKANFTNPTIDPSLLPSLPPTFFDTFTGMISNAFTSGMPILNSALQGAQQGAALGPMGMAGGAIIGLLSQSETFGKLMEKINPLLQTAADTVGKFLEPLMPLVDIVVNTLNPVLKILGELLSLLLVPVVKVLEPGLKMLGLIVLVITKAIASAYNLIAKFINSWGGNMKLWDTSGIDKSIKLLLDPDYAENQEAIQKIVSQIESGVSSAITNAFKAKDIDELKANLYNGVQEEIKKALKDGFMASSTIKPLLTMLNEGIATAVLDGIISAEEKAGLIAAVQAIYDQASPLFQAIQELDLGFGDLADAANKASSAMLNVPEGFKVESVRYDSSQPARVGSNNTTVNNNQTIVLQFNGANPAENYRYFQEAMARDNVTSNGLPVTFTPQFTQ